MVVRTSAPGRTERPAPSPGLQAYVDGIPVPAALLDDHCRIRALNRAWESQARPGGLVAPSDRVGADHLHDLRDKGFQRDAGRQLAQVLESVASGQRREARFDYTIGADDGDSHWEAVMTGIDLTGSRHVLLVHWDRTLERQHAGTTQRVAELLLEREQHAAVERDRQRLLLAGEQSFHAPMTPIRLQLHMLRTGNLGKLTRKQEAALDRIERNVHRWWHLQEEFIQELKALAGTDHTPEAVDATFLLEEAMQPFNERALKAGVKLRIDRSTEPLPVRVDRRKAVQVMMLLLDHAIRQTPAGGLVWVRMRNVGRDAELVIQDQDPGMDPDQAESMLDPEGRETSLRSGLLHARAVLAIDRGRLGVRCAGAGQGLEVTVTLPLV